jgi:beta-xylosidase
MSLKIWALSLFLKIWALSPLLYAQNWIPDLGNGKYKNPVIYADYSDPDVIRVDDNFYMVASSFNCMPGIPVLKSGDLVNWTIIGHVYDSLPFEKYNKPAHGQGSWAPSIRYRNGFFNVYFCTPHEGLFMAKAKDPAGPWELNHIVDVEMWEDPCPFWDDDSSAYIVRSKLGGSILYLHRMSEDGMKLLDNGTIIFHNEDEYPTIEGPKFLKRDGYYYIFAPAGGVRQGWQAVLRSNNIYGPYDSRVVLHKGSTNINGPHQGGIVSTKSGEWWFLHFQDMRAYGRIVHLQPVRWENGWPLMGVDIDGDSIGEPVSEYTKPQTESRHEIAVPPTTDEFDPGVPGLQWQWHANPSKSWYSMSDNPGYLRLYAVQNLSQEGNLWFAPNLLLQKFPAPTFEVATSIIFNPGSRHEKAGIAVMGKEWAFIALEKAEHGIQIVMYRGEYNRHNNISQKIDSIDISNNSCYLKVKVDTNALCTFLYSEDNIDYTPLGKEFPASEGIWIGAKIGLFCINPNITESKGYADFDWFRFE